MSSSYAAVEDVLRILGTTVEGVKEHFDVRLWDGDYPLSPVTVDGETYDLPNVIRARIEKEIGNASSKLDSYILQAYQGRPALPYPDHLIKITAKLAVYNILSDDGVKTEWITMLWNEARGFMKDLAAKKVDLGIEGPRPNYRAPAAIVVRGVGGRGRHGRRRRCGGGC